MATTEARRSPLGRAHLVPDDPEYLAELRRAYVEWTSGVDALVGIWLIVAPWVLGFATCPVRCGPTSAWARPSCWSLCCAS